MPWRNLIWVFTLLIAVLFAGSCVILQRSVRSLVRPDGRRLARLFAIAISSAILIFSLFAFWFAWPLITGTNMRIDNPAEAKRLGLALTEPGHSILAVVAHPDDAEWYAGGTLAAAARAGSTVTVIVATNGEKGHGGARPGTLGPERKKEQQEAARMLGYSRLVFLDLPDRGLLREAATLRDRIEAEWEISRPHIVLAFDSSQPARPYVHPDHQAVGYAVESILSERPADPVAAYLFSSARPDSAVDITAVAGLKLSGLRAHRSQYGSASGEGALHQNSMSGEAMGWKYAETFRLRRPDLPLVR